MASGDQGGASEKVLEFIRAAKAQGMDDDFVTRLLRHNGWSERAIFQTYSSYYGERLQQPVPSRGAGIENARHAFFYLLAFITLGTWTFALGNLFYVLIDRMLHDPLAADYTADYVRANISFDLAAIIIAFPIFLWMMWIIQHEATQRPEVLDSGVRKWLTYLALVVTASSLIGDAVVFLQDFLNGSLTQAFILKSVVLVAIAGGVFVYYLGAVRAETATVRRDQIFAGVAIVAVCISIGIGFLQNGTPLAQRESAFDQRRVNDLQQIASLLRDSWTANGKHQLPSKLDALFVNRTRLLDPQTHHAYTYHTYSGPRYRLCAVFETSNLNDPGNDAWRHAAGLTCFNRDASAPGES